MNLRYVVITSVDRDDLRDGGAQHFADCIKAIRETSPNTKIEILVPDSAAVWTSRWKSWQKRHLT